MPEASAASVSNATTTRSTQDSSNKNADTTASPPNDSNNDRLENTTACLPIVYGSIAFALTKQARDAVNTHSWTLYLRSPQGEDLSPVVQKVVFMLHPSFAQPMREITSPPFQVTEKGWGEFEAEIQIHWKSEEMPTHILHGLRLYAAGEAGSKATNNSNNSNNKAGNSDPVIAEKYDQVVFTNPKESFFKQLQQVATPSDTFKLTTTDDDENDSEYTKILKKHLLKIQYSDTEDFLALIEAQKFLQNEVKSVKDRLEAADRELAVLDEQIIAQVQRQQQEKAATRLEAKAGRASGSSIGGGGDKSVAPTVSKKRSAAAVAGKTKSGKVVKSKTGNKKVKTSKSGSTTGTKTKSAAATSAASGSAKS